MAKAQIKVIRNKKTKYIDPKGPGPKKDPVKTIALAVLPQQRPFHKYLSEELQEAYLSSKPDKMKAFFDQLSKTCVDTAATDVTTYYHISGMSRFFYLHWKGGFKMEDSQETQDLFFNAGLIDALFTVLSVSVANFDKLLGKNKAIPYLVIDIMQDLTGGHNVGAKKLGDAICLGHSKELDEIIYDKFLCLKFTVMEQMSSLLLVTNLLIFKSGFEWFMSRDRSEMLETACKHSFHLGSLLKETCIFNKLPRKLEKAIIQSHADINDNIDLAINTIEGKKSSFTHLYTRSFDTACNLNRMEELCKLYYKHDFFGNLVARMLHFCPGCSMYPGRDHQGLQALTYATAHLLYYKEGQDRFLDTLPYKDGVVLPGLKTLQCVHVPVQEPKMSTISVLGVVTCHAMTSSVEPFPCPEAREIISLLLTNKRKMTVIECIGDEVIDIAHGSNITKRAIFVYNKSYIEALLECGGFSFSYHPSMKRYPHYDYLMHRHMFDRYMPRMPHRLLRDLEERDIPECSLEAAFICCKYRHESKLGPGELSRNILRAEKIFARAKDYLDAEIVEKYPACEYMLSKALAICPMHATKNLSAYYLERAYVRIKLNQLPKAVRDCTRALLLDPKEFERIQWIRSRALFSQSLFYPAWVDAWSLKDAYMEYHPPFFEEYKSYLKKLENRLNFYKHSSPF